MDEAFDSDAPNHLQQYEGASNVGLNDRGRLVDAAIHMGLRREMDYRVAASHSGFDCAGIADVPFDKPISGVLFHRSQVGKICSVG